MWMVVGLGNPGTKYATHRHNIGFMVVDELARRWKLESGWRAKFGGEVLQKVVASRVGGEASGLRRGGAEEIAHDNNVIALKPQEFMNVSGQAVQRTATFYKIEVKEIIVVHDELDLDFGKLRVKVGGGHGGHNGLRSITEHLGADYLRVRCGIGKPTDKGQDNERVAGHVLSDFSKEEKKELPFLVGGAADAVELIINKGATIAMNRVNTEKQPAPQ